MVTFERGWIKIELPAPLAAQQAGRVTVFENNKPQGVYISPQLPNICAMRNQAERFIKAVRGVQAAPCVSSVAVRDLAFSVDYINYVKKLEVL